MTKKELGDWQTPVELARAALGVVARRGPTPAVVLEPTCGEGSFLVAAAERFRRAALVGYELNERYAATARDRLPPKRARVTVADFFRVDWDRALADLPEPILIAGNPPWVTNAALGGIGSTNLPEKRNFKGLTGYEALTGKSNFDVSEWMLLRLLEALQGRRATVAVLCKTAVARRVVELATAKRWSVRPGGLWRIDAMRHFRAAVDAVLFVCDVGGDAPTDARWPRYAALDAELPTASMAVVGGAVVADADALERTAHLAGSSDPEWRSGLKHDCARVMELELQGRRWVNGLGEEVAVEDHLLFALMKSSDVARGGTPRARAVIVPQTALGEDTSRLRQTAPRAWHYLSTHRERLRARKSAVYRGQPDFAIFGVGPYSFAPWKVAVSGLYKRCAFSVVGPRRDKPVMLDDTCYFLPFASEEEARSACEALRSPIAQDFFAARIFWDAKRPINKALLQKLDLAALLTATAGRKKEKKFPDRVDLAEPRVSPPRQGSPKRPGERTRR
ncbi:MAG: hypothetical protein KF764_05500 [Labilithrix sp.]|nr:hypothetical protein [Labilithrix sp.]MBX3219066.1 hypothetical protein [Labilithrix sp.]